MTEIYNRYGYAFNNPLSFTDPSGWWPQNDPAENYDEPTGYAPTGGGDVYYVLPNWYNGPSDPFAGCGFDWDGRMHDAYINTINTRPREAGPGFEDLYTLMEGTEGGGYVSNSDFISTSNSQEIAYLWKYVDRTILNPPKNHFTNGYNPGQDAWNYSLLASNNQGGANSYGAALAIAAARTSGGWGLALGEPTIAGEVVMGVTISGYALYLYLAGKGNANYPGPWSTTHKPWYLDPIHKPSQGYNGNNLNVPPGGPGTLWYLLGAGTAASMYYDWKISIEQLDKAYPSIEPADNTRVAPHWSPYYDH